MSEHTPTPWTLHAPVYIEPYITAKGSLLIATASGASNESHANAAFIVKAVNAHEVLVKALEECAIRCRYDGDLFHDQGNEMRMNASWKAADLANAVLASIKERA